MNRILIEAKNHGVLINYKAIATYDDASIEFTKNLVKEYNISHDQIKFQMLFGIRNERQVELAEEAIKCVFTN